MGKERLLNQENALKTYNNAVNEVRRYEGVYAKLQESYELELELLKTERSEGVRYWAKLTRTQAFSNEEAIRLQEERQSLINYQYVERMKALHARYSSEVANCKELWQLSENYRRCILDFLQAHYHLREEDLMDRDESPNQKFQDEEVVEENSASEEFAKSPQRKFSNDAMSTPSSFQKESEESEKDVYTTKRVEFKLRLRLYIKEVKEKRLKEEPKKINFQAGFIFCVNSRALNREANFKLAKWLLGELKNENSSLPQIFQTDLLAKRAELMGHGFEARDHGIHSKTLRGIIHDAKVFCDQYPEVIAAQHGTH